MNHETKCRGIKDWGTSNVERRTLNIEWCRRDADASDEGPCDLARKEFTTYLEKEDLAAIADCRYIDALDFDCIKAKQAREEFIKTTIIFFGLDGECPSLECTLSA